MPPQLVQAGTIAPLIDHILVSGDEIRSAVKHAIAFVSFTDVAILVCCGWLLVPCLDIVYTFIDAKRMKKEKKCGSEFERSYLFVIVDHLSQASRLALFVYSSDCILASFGQLGYETDVASKVFAKIIYTIWAARRFMSFKSYLIGKWLNVAPDKCEKIKLMNRLVDGMVSAFTLVKILDFLRIGTGFAFSSILSVGATGGLIISLASQEVAKGLVNSIEMSVSDRFYEGDNVLFGDGTAGIVHKMGFLRTKIQKFDSTVVDIPNTQLGDQRITNISRVKTCRVLTTLRFEYADIQKLPHALGAVKEEIAEACPTLIKEGKPFQAMISSFEFDHVEVIVTTYYNLPPTGEEFWKNRQEMFLAIDRGVMKSKLQYAKPIYRVKA